MKTSPADRSRRKEARLTFYAGPPRLFGDVLLEARVPSRLSLKNELIQKVLSTLEHKGLAADKATLARWRLCLDEALVNAIVHGNNGDPRRFVSLKLMSGKRRWAVLVEDEGKGFSPRELTRADSPHALYSESGRGVLIMRQFADDVRYYHNGSAVLLVKSIKPEAAAASAASERTGKTVRNRKKTASSGSGGKTAANRKKASNPKAGRKAAAGRKKASNPKAGRKAAAGRKKASNPKAGRKAAARKSSRAGKKKGRRSGS